MTQGRPAGSESEGIIDAWLAQRLAGAAVSLPSSLGSDGAAAIAERVRLHGIALALCRAAPGVGDLPSDVQEPILDEARLQALWEETHRRMLVDILALLQEQAIACLFLKGTALAYSVYEDPAMRRRGDSDLLVLRHQVAKVRKVFKAAGLVPAHDNHFGQETWLFDTGAGFVHAIDLHWETVASPALRKLVPIDACFARNVPLPRLAPTARA